MNSLTRTLLIISLFIAIFLMIIITLFTKMKINKIKNEYTKKENNSLQNFELDKLQRSDESVSIKTMNYILQTIFRNNYKTFFWGIQKLDFENQALKKIDINSNDENFDIAIVDVTSFDEIMVLYDKLNLKGMLIIVNFNLDKKEIQKLESLLSAKKIRYDLLNVEENLFLIAK